MSSIPASLSHPLGTMPTMASRTPQLDTRVRRSSARSPRPDPRSAQPARPRRLMVEAPDAPSASRRRGGVYRRRRAIALLFVVVLVAAVLALAFVGGRATADGEPAGEIRPTQVYVVRPGDTLWDIAVRLAPDRDPRAVVSALERSAGGSTIRAGQRIVLPASLQG